MLPRTVRLVWWVRVGVIGLCLIGVAIVARRAVQLIPIVLSGETPSASPGEQTALDFWFTSKPWLTLAHIAPALVFVILAPVQFSRRVRVRYPRYHRTAGRVAAAAGAAAGVTALALSFRDPIGGMNEAVASVFFGLLFLFALAKGVAAARRREFGAHREWMIRAFAIALAVATTRPIVGVFFAISPLTGLTPREFFGTAFWIAFTTHLVAAEGWIQSTRAARSSDPQQPRKPT